jgi:hypothetical protein
MKNSLGYEVRDHVPQCDCGRPGTIVERYDALRLPRVRQVARGALHGGELSGVPVPRSAGEAE